MQDFSLKKHSKLKIGLASAMIGASLLAAGGYTNQTVHADTVPDDPSTQNKQATDYVEGDTQDTQESQATKLDLNKTKDTKIKHYQTNNQDSAQAVKKAPDYNDETSVNAPSNTETEYQLNNSKAERAAKAAQSADHDSDDQTTETKTTKVAQAAKKNSASAKTTGATQAAKKTAKKTNAADTVKTSLKSVAPKAATTAPKASYTLNSTNAAKAVNAATESVNVADLIDDLSGDSNSSSINTQAANTDNDSGDLSSGSPSTSSNTSSDVSDTDPIDPNTEFDKSDPNLIFIDHTKGLQDITQNINVSVDDLNRTFVLHQIIEKPDGTKDQTDTTAVFYRNAAYHKDTKQVEYGTWHLDKDKTKGHAAVNVQDTFGHQAVEIGEDIAIPEIKNYHRVITYSTQVVDDKTNTEHQNSDYDTLTGVRVDYVTHPEDSAGTNMEKLAPNFEMTETAKYVANTETGTDTKTVTRTINVEGQKPVVQSATFERSKTTNLATNKSTYGNWHLKGDDKTTQTKFASYTAPAKDGYYSLVDGKKGNSVSEEAVTADTPNSTINITYQKNPINNGNQTVRYVDDESGQVLDTETGSGKIGSQVTIKPTVPKGYETDNIQTEFTIKDQDTPITIRLKHITVPVSHTDPKTTDDEIELNGQDLGKYPEGVSDSDLNRTVTRNINLHLPTGSKQVVQNAKIYRDATIDLATGKITYTDWSTSKWDEYKPASVDGYKASVSDIPEVKITSQSQNVSLDVDYDKVDQGSNVTLTPSEPETKTSYSKDYVPDEPVMTTADNSTGDGNASKLNLGDTNNGDNNSNNGVANNANKGNNNANAAKAASPSAKSTGAAQGSGSGSSSAPSANNNAGNSGNSNNSNAPKAAKASSLPQTGGATNYDLLVLGVSAMLLGLSGIEVERKRRRN